MMNKSKIDWCNFSWNPVTGCRKNCISCYGRKLSQRLSGNIRLNLGSPQIEKDMENRLFTLPQPFHTEYDSVLLFPVGFEPTFHPYRLQMISDKKKSENIFVSSMGDLFGDCVPTEWIVAVFEACKAAPWHNYMFLTCNPKRYQELAESGILIAADNFWYGSRIYESKEAFVHKDYHTFLCIEPLDAEALDYVIPKTEWIILGCTPLLPSRKNRTEKSWIESLVSQKGEIPLFMIDNDAMRNAWQEKLIREYPPLLWRPTPKPIPRCKACKQCHIVREGKRGDRCTCRHSKILKKHKDTSGKHIPGQYTRTSPPWCPKR